MKHLSFLTTIFLFVAITLSMSACSPSASSAETKTSPTSPQSAMQAAVVVSFDPNPVPNTDGYWRYEVTLTETMGVGVTLNSLVLRYYTTSGPAGQPQVYDTSEWFDKWLPNGYLPANEKVTTGSGLPVQPISYGVFTYNGVDENGHEIVAEGRVDLEQ